MDKIILIIFIILTLVLVVIISLLYLQIWSIQKQLLKIKEAKQTNSLIVMDKFGLGFKKMIFQLNFLLNQHNENQMHLRKKSAQLQDQIIHISHDLRTPLTSIMGYLELIAKTDNEEERNEYLEIVLRRSKNVQTLINDFYEIFRLEEKQTPMEIQAVAPHLILEDAVLSFYEVFNQKNIEVKVNIEAGNKIFAAEKALMRVYTNLLQNILQHGESFVQIDHFEKNGVLQTIFSNCIKENEQIEVEFLFDRFYTGDKSRSQEGSGLGLYISKLLIEQMGHKIKAEILGSQLRIVITYGKIIN